MKSENSKAILAKGLSEGYVGKSIRGSVERAGFNLETSDYRGPEGSYHDEWDADFNGGGQEIVETPNGEKATRVYAGGTLAAEELAKLNLTKKAVIGELIFFVNKLGHGTRLDENAEATDGADWKYKYEVLESQKEIPVDLGKETITYKNNLVFIHYHVVSPVK
ncbi:MAG TPA: hypothetical protein VL401_00745 [Alphaproteobacteria bacterium]|jgi:hypothetical protein|nr:hypothetical protein [Alphaproteobacteria bacterium]